MGGYILLDDQLLRTKQMNAVSGAGLWGKITVFIAQQGKNIKIIRIFLQTYLLYLRVIGKRICTVKRPGQYGLFMGNGSEGKQIYRG